MTLEARTLDIAGPIVIAPSRSRDPRGFFSETYNARALRDIGIDQPFVQDNHTLSVERGTVRGFHFQAPPHAQAKLIRVVRGRILDVIVDIRRGSPTYGGHASVELSAENWLQLYVPEGFAHAFCTLETDTEVIYKVTAYWVPASERGLRWNDPALKIAWPACAGASVAPRDQTLPPLADLVSPFA